MNATGYNKIDALQLSKKLLKNEQNGQNKTPIKKIVEEELYRVVDLILGCSACNNNNDSLKQFNIKPLTVFLLLRLVT